MNILKGIAVAASVLICDVAVAQDFQMAQREEAQLIETLAVGVRCDALDRPQRTALEHARRDVSLQLRLAGAGGIDDAAVARQVAEEVRAGSSPCTELVRTQVQQIANDLISINLIRANAALEASRGQPWANQLTSLEPHASGVAAQVARMRSANAQAAAELGRIASIQAPDVLALVCESRQSLRAPAPRQCPGVARPAPDVQLASQWLAGAEAVVQALADGTPSAPTPPIAVQRVMPESLLGYFRLVSLGPTSLDVTCTLGDWVVKDPRPGENPLYTLGSPQPIGTVSLITRDGVWAVVGYDEAARRANAGGAASILPCRV